MKGIPNICIVFVRKFQRSSDQALFLNNRAAEMFKTGDEQVIRTLKSSLVVKPKE